MIDRREEYKEWKLNTVPFLNEFHQKEKVLNQLYKEYHEGLRECEVDGKVFYVIDEILDHVGWLSENQDKYNEEFNRF